MVLQRSERVVPGPVEREQVRILDQQSVEAAKQLVVLDRVVIRPHICELPHLDQVPVIEIETAARHPKRLARNRERRTDSRMNKLSRRRVSAGAALAPAARLASFEKSVNRKI